MKPITFIVLSLILVGCTNGAGNSSQPVNSTELSGTQWYFEANSLVDVWVEPVAGTKPTLSFENDRLSGYSGCNTFFATYTQTGNKLVVGKVGSTLVGCTDEVQHQESVILEALENAESFERVEQMLHIHTGGGTALVFRQNREPLIDHGGLHTFDTCVYNNGVIDPEGTQCEIEGRVYHEGE